MTARLVMVWPPPTGLPNSKYLELRNTVWLKRPRAPRQLMKRILIAQRAGRLRLDIMRGRARSTGIFTTRLKSETGR